MNDLKDPDSEYLASEHYQNRWVSEDQCFTCHSDYGIFGNMKAKIGGIRHVWAYYTGTRPPSSSTGLITTPYAWRRHAPVIAFQEEEEHEKNAADILSSKMSCLGMDCHVRPHPEEAWKAELILIPWVRKAVIAAGVLNLIALVTIILTLFKFTPLTMILSVSVGGACMGIAIIIYVIVVIKDLRKQGIL